MPTPRQLDVARELFEQYEPRDLFYRVALDLLRRARSGRGEFTVDEALAVVLQTWNRRFYIATGIPFDAEHFAAIEALLDRHHAVLRGYQRRSIKSLIGDEQGEIEAIFDDFDGCSDRLARPRHFMYSHPDSFRCGTGRSRAGVLRFGSASAARIAVSIGAGFFGCDASARSWAVKQWGPGLLKRIEEFYYCRFTLEVI